MQRPTGALCDGCHSVNYDVHTKTVTEWNVGCEACHGAGRAHVLDPVADTIVNPARLDDVRSNDVCIQCHSQGVCVSRATRRSSSPGRAGQSNITRVTRRARSVAPASRATCRRSPGPSATSTCAATRSGSSRRPTPNATASPTRARRVTRTRPTRGRSTSLVPGRTSRRRHLQPAMTSRCLR